MHTIPVPFPEDLFCVLEVISIGFMPAPTAAVRLKAHACPLEPARNILIGVVKAFIDGFWTESAAECGKLNHPAFRIITNISPLVSVIRDSPCLNNFCSEFFKMRIVASDIQVGSKFGGLSRYDQHCKNKAKTQKDDFSSLSFHVVSPLCSFFACNCFNTSYPLYTTYTTVWHINSHIEANAKIEEIIIICDTLTCHRSSPTPHRISESSIILR